MHVTTAGAVSGERVCRGGGVREGVGECVYGREGGRVGGMEGGRGRESMSE